MALNSPVEYYGGKSYMTDVIIEHFPSSYDLYVEGFGGGASVLLNKPVTPLEIYNDLEQNIYSLFKVISDEDAYKRLQYRLYLTPYSKQLREEYKQYLLSELSIEDRAYYFFYVNRTSFNGVGGFSFNPLVRRECSKSISGYLSAVDGLEDIHSRICHAVIENRDIFELLDKYDDKNTFFYLDPPYVQETRLSNQRYAEEFDNDKHKALIDKLLSMKGKVLLSGYEHPIYDKLVDSGWHVFKFYNNNTVSTATEFLWWNYDIESEKSSLW